MFQPLSMFVGLRYVRARQHTFFVSFITWVSLGGVALGVAALIVVLSVMNGLKNELRDRLLTLTAHARVVDPRPAGTVDDAALAPGHNRLMLGEALAEQLGASEGDAVTMLVPIASADAPPEPQMRVFTV